MTVLQARGLVAGRARFRLGPLDLDLEAGSLTALIGPNGSGKTTLLMTLAGLLAPLTGTVERIGAAALLPPPGATDVPFTVRHCVLLGRVGRQGLRLRFSARDHARADEVLAELGLLPLADRRFDRLSSGQQQRVLLARALAQDAAVCLLDEPFALLDPAQVAQVDATLSRMRALRRALVVATHDLAMAGRADRIVALSPVPTVGVPGEILAPDRLRALYGVNFQPCHSCGQLSAVTTVAD